VAINSETWETLNPDGTKTHFEFGSETGVGSKHLTFGFGCASRPPAAIAEDVDPADAQLTLDTSAE
jgi:hypothetical protein